ncbi:MAG: ferrous iron transporter B [Clostridia bacterium]|nr:ferrous iron transporter B [Clostridia bacterium]
MGLTKSSTGKNACDRFLDIKTGDITVALMGNPNVGKSTLFNYLTGMRQHTGNWPGKTVTGASGNCTYKNKEITFVDLPGCYSLLSHSPEEEVARDFVVSGEADVTVVVCDATALERNLILVLQTQQITKKLIVCVNLIDEAEKKGIKIDKEKLEKELGAPVITTAARSGKGVNNLLDKIVKAKETAENENTPLSGEEIEETVNRAAQIADACVRFKNTNLIERDRKIDKILTGRPAYAVMLLMLLGIFWLTIAGANSVSGALSGALFKTEEWLNLALIQINTPDFLRELVVFGGYRMLVWVVSVMLPPMAIFFPLFTILEDLGYLPRVAFNLDKCFKRCGACGKQALTMCMGFGCNAAGVVGARIIDSPRERLIAIITNSLVPCNGRFPALISVITVFIVGGVFMPSVVLTGAITLGIVMTFLASKFLSRTFLKGETSSFVLELPPYRRPQIGKVIVRSVFDRTLFVLGRAVATAIPAGLLLWLLANINIGDTSLFACFCQSLEPLGNVMGLDGVILAAFILGFTANETVIPIMLMGYISGTVLTDGVSLAQLRDVLVLNGWNIVTAVNMIVFFLFHWPCATTMLTIYKETKSAKWTALSFALPTVIGVFICIAVNLLCNLLA